MGRQLRMSSTATAGLQKIPPTMAESAVRASKMRGGQITNSQIQVRAVRRIICIASSSEEGVFAANLFEPRPDLKIELTQ